MTEDDWNRYRPESAAGYRLGEMVAVFPDHAIFRGHAEQTSGLPDVSVWLIDVEDGSIEARVNRFLEATFFDHPNLLRVFAAQPLEASGPPLIQVITEPFDFSLNGAEHLRPFNLETLKPVLLPVAAGLAWLHSQNLIYCALRADSIVSAGSKWKLADFSELRVAGRSAPEETRRLLIRRDLYVPPEAYEGVVSPAWDAWSIGLLIQSLYAREARAVRRNPRILPAATAELVRGLGDTDPAQRLGVTGFAELLAKSSRQPEPIPKHAVEEDAPVMRAFPVTQRTSDAHEDANSEFDVHADIDSKFDVHEDIDPELRRKRAGILAAVSLVFGAIVVIAVLYGRPVSVKSNPNPDAAVTGAPSGGTPTGNPSPATVASAARSQTSRPDPFDAGRSLNPGKIAETKRQISALLNRWIKSTRERDAAAQAELYAPVVEQFYGRRNATSDDVRRAKARGFAQVGAGREFWVEDIRFERIDSDQAIVSFVKTWDFPARPFAGSTREEMVIRRVDGIWKISSERELNHSERSPAIDSDSISTSETATRGNSGAGNQ